MAYLPFQLLLYDTAVRSWVTSNFSTLLSPKSFTVLIGTPDRPFAEYLTVTGTTPRDGRPPLPRCAITLGELERDEARFNGNVIRKLGLTNNNLEIKRGNYPVPINRTYTLDFWTEDLQEMSQFKMQLFELFRFNYLYLSVDIDSISATPTYGTKDIGLHLLGGMTDSGDMEPGTQERIVRRTIDLQFKIWLWDFNSPNKYSLKHVETQYYDDEDFTNLLTTADAPPRETLVAGVNGVQTVFGPVNTSKLPIIENTFLIDATIGGTNYRGRDDGAGNIVDPDGEVASGSVNYTTGEVSVTYNTAPDAGSDITALFYTSVE